MSNPNLRFRREDGTSYPEWNRKSFSNTFSPLNNNTFSRDMLSENGTVCNIHYGDILVKFGEVCDIQTTDIPKVNADIDTSKFDKLQDGDIILADTAEDETVGKATEIYCVGTSKVISGLHTMACRPNEKYAPKYLGYYINSPTYHNQLIPFMQGIKVTSIGRKNIADTIIYYPSDIEEQQKIANFLSSVDEVIAQSEAEVSNLQQQKKAAMQKIFSQEVRFKREDGTEFPEWGTTSLNDVCDIVGGGTPSTENKDYWDGNIQWFTPSEIGKSKYVSKSARTISQIGFEKSSARKLPVGTILLTSRATLGEMAITTEECTTNQGFQSLVPRKIYGEYLYYLQPTIKNYCYKKACGSTFNEISKGELGKCKIPYPHLEEQKTIANFLSTYDEAIGYAKQELDKLKELKKGLLQQMFV